VRSRFGLAFRIERLGGELAVGFFQKNFDAAFGFFELLLAFTGERHAFFEELHGIVERELGAFETADDFLEAGEGALKIRLLGRLGFFGGGLIHRVNVCPRTVAEALSILRHAREGKQGAKWRRNVPRVVLSIVGP